MKIEKNKMVSLIYELREGNSEGMVIETLEESKPMTFVFGTGGLSRHSNRNYSLLKQVIISILCSMPDLPMAIKGKI